MKLIFKYCFYLLLLLPFGLAAQVKSTNVQTIQGKKYYIHKLEKGQSLYALTRLYGVDLKTIYAENPQAEKSTKVGEEIKIPFVTVPTVSTPTLTAPTATTTIDTNRYITYKVTKGETLYSLSKKLNQSEKELEKRNPTLALGVKEGQLLIIGEKRKTAGTIAVAALPTKTATPVFNLDSINPHVIRPKKQSYTIGLFLPFRLDQTLATDINYLASKKQNFPNLSTLAIDFYLGFKRAVDSLTSKDLEINLNLFDVDDKDSGKIESLVNAESFKQLDMVVGPLYAGGFKTASQKAKQLSIPIISPFTQQNKILFNNVWTSKMTPSQYTLLEGLADYCIDSLKQSNGHLMIVSAGKDVKEQAFVKAFKNYYNDRLSDRKRGVVDTVTEVKGIAGVKAAYKSGVKNIVVTFSANQVFIMDFITQLSIFSGKKDMVLCGWQNISALENLDQEYLNQLQFTFPAQNNITNTTAYQTLSKDYKQQMNTAPSEYFFEGFDLGYYYLKSLKENGIDGLLSLDKQNLELPYTRFKFYRPDNSTGFDNKGMYIFKYNNYKIERTGWK